MSLKWLKTFLLTFICLSQILTEVRAGDLLDEKHINVTLRMIGHQVLLNAGDSNSRVLPVQTNGSRNTIQFDAEFSFNPDDLKVVVDSILAVAGINTPYVLEVQQCQTGDIIYSYEIGEAGQSDIVPCRSRDQIKSCYNIILSFASVEPNSATPKLFYYSVAILLLFISLWLLFYRFRKKGSGQNDHLIKLGRYHFDQRHSMLILKEQKTELTSKEADLLLLLYQAVNTTVERDDILNKVWGDEGDYIGRTLDVFISKLRKKLDADPGIKLVNVRGVGYKLIVDP